jgi:hypothetical protein
MLCKCVAAQEKGVVYSKTITYPTGARATFAKPLPNPNLLWPKTPRFSAL